MAEPEGHEAERGASAQLLERAYLRAALVAQSLTVAVVLTLLLVTPAFAHEQPDGDEWVMADWMLWSFLVFGGAAVVGLIVAIRRGWLSNLESNKYFILTLDEPDYYTPDWAREEL